ncbi:MAG: glycosyltransferase family 2 protein [Candidatus Accumulibacter sp.]|jgi:predicted LPLAT superfamily acyltransferase|nr:glycosyltransferase family 2 protein [Accumulibacter sp.]
MKFNPCFVIPVFDHWKQMREMVKSLSEHGSSIYIVDDGSNDETRSVLDSLAREFRSVRLFRLQENAGKGAAVMHGMLKAFEDGCSHALQIDADGQHDVRDVPRFLRLARINPEALICGAPLYDASIPKKRFYGRYITHFWVCVETLSFRVRDSMCGFRLYPLKSVCALIRRVNLPKRMNFDVEILVRMAWEGVPMESVPTRVVYPPDGLSHFDMLKDNIRISLTHVRLFTGMLFRLPVLLFRKVFAGRAARAHWSGLAERGSMPGLLFLVIFYRLFGERAARVLVFLIVVYFFITGKRARDASMDYLKRVRAFGGNGMPAPGLMSSFSHMLSFGYSGLERLAAWMGKSFDGRIEFVGRAELADLIAAKKGAVLIASHLGNPELARAFSMWENVTINFVVYMDHARLSNTALSRVNAGFGANLVQIPSVGPDTAILLKEKIERGELVVITGDRTPPLDAKKDRIIPVSFLGEEAPFAQGPFILASLLDCPVYLFFCLQHEKGFRIYLERFAGKIELPRGERRARLRDYMLKYAKRLEHYCLMAPCQWFNFYDFWQHRVHEQEDKNG